MFEYKMFDKHSIVVICLFFSFQLCSGIYIPISDEPRLAYTSGIKTTVKKPVIPDTLQNYSKVVVHNRPDSPGAQYVVTTIQEVRNVYPVYNAHTFEQRPQQHPNILQTQSHAEINADLLGFSTTKPNRTIIKRKIESKTLEVYKKCPPGETGQFIYSLSCNQFLNCWKGRGSVQNCSPGTLFNPKTLECDFPKKVECITGPRSNDLESLRVPKSVKQATCPEGFSGIIPDYFDCSKFINCDNGKPNKMDCAPGTLFDMYKNICDYPHQTTCFNGDSQSILATKTDENQGYYDNINNGQNNCGHTNCGQNTQYTNQQTDHNGYQQSTYSQMNCDSQNRNCKPNYGQSINYGQGSGYEQSGNDLGTGQTTIYTQTISHTCNPATQNCGPTSDSNSRYNQQTICNPSIQNCQNFGQSTQTRKCNPLVQNCPSQSSIYGNDLTTVENTVNNQGQGCNPQIQNCGQYNNNDQKAGHQNIIYTQTVTHRCNPKTQICGHYSTQQPNGYNTNYGQTLIEENTGQQTDDSLITKYCDPSANKNCKGSITPGQQNEYLSNNKKPGYQNVISTQTVAQGCDPGTHICGQQSNGYETNYGQITVNENTGQQTDDSSYASLKPNHCDPRVDKNCKGSITPGQQIEYLSNNKKPGYQNVISSQTVTQGCDPKTLICGQISNGETNYGHITVGEYTGQQTDESNYASLKPNHCDPRVDKNCKGSITPGQQNEYLGNGHGELGRHNCNPAIHNCDSYIQSQNSRYNGQGRQTYNCNPAIQNCDSTTQTIRHYNGGQTFETTNTQSNNLGSGDSFQLAAGCNPFLQKCNTVVGKNINQQSTGTNANISTGGTFICNLSEPNCGHGKKTKNEEHTQTNYNNICNVNDNNCRQKQNPVVNSQPVCPDGVVGMQKHPTDCKKYLTCGSGQTFIMDCAPGTLFNSETGMCDFPYNVKCEISDSNTNTHYEKNNIDSGHGYIRTSTEQSSTNWNQQTNNNWGQNTGNSWKQPINNNWDQHIDNTPKNGANWGQHTDNTQEVGQKLDVENTFTESNRGESGYLNRPTQKSNDYDDIYDPKDHRISATTARSAWPSPHQGQENDEDYVFTYIDGSPVTLEPENVILAKEKRTKHCGDDDFRCTPNLCISLTMVCDGERDCVDGKDEINCQEYTQRFSVTKNSQLVVVENQRWINVTYSTCALLCIQNTKFTCRSFTYRKPDRTCFLSDKNIGLAGSLQSHQSSDYYELKDGTIDCSDKSKYFECPNKKCLTKEYLCDGYDDCNDREDEKHCDPAKFNYKIKLAGSSQKHEGRVEVTAFGKTGYICDDEFGIADANVICRELGFELGAAEIKGQSHFAKDLKESETLYMMDDLNCRGNESTLLDCSFPGWGVHNCKDQEIAGVTCKTPQEKCADDSWKCDSGNECLPYDFVCDGVEDCTDVSDESTHHCEAPTELRLTSGSHAGEGRIEIKHNGIWGTICDDDFNEDAGKVVCKFLGFKGKVTVKKESFYGPGVGPIWLDQVSCFGNETELHQCTHWNWGEHNCEHTEDVGVICSNDPEEVKVERHSNLPVTIEEGLPKNCGMRKDNLFATNDLIHARVIGGGVAHKGDYPWQAALKVRVKDKSAHWCGAVIISSKWVITAAHCLQGYTKGAYIIVAGEYNTDENEGTEQQKYIDEFFVHKQFRKGHKLNNDIALIKVKGSGFELNDDVQPICLADADTDYNRDLNCTISGFGSVKSGVSAYSHNLLAAWIPVNSQDICKMPHVYGDVLTDNMICAGSMDGGLDACDGDSGGPLACLDRGVFTLYGITSWGQHCGYANKPGVYVKVGNYKQWIEDTISQHSQ